ncbi:MAG: penicillin-binding protein 2 [Actinomycetota bacterium]
MTEGRTVARVRVLALFVVVMFVALSARLWFLQVLASDDFRSQASRNSVRVVQTVAPRGRIVDDHNHILVGNRPSLTLLVNRQRLGSQADVVLPRLSKLLKIPEWQLRQSLSTNLYYSYTPVPVAFDVKPAVRYYIGEHQSDFPGVSVDEVPVRTYPYGRAAAHVLGYTGQISSEQLKAPAYAGYEPGDIVGKAGVEQVYEPYLQGTKGVRKYLVDASGQNLGPIGAVQDPVQGDTLHLTLDLKAQQIAEESLKLGMENARGYADSSQGGLLKANAGAVVVMDPNTGAIVAMASAPTYDPGLFTGGITQQQLDKLQSPGSNEPLIDRAIQGLYPPGSTYKPFVAAAALQSGIANETSNYECPATYTAPSDTVGQQTVFHNWTTANLGYMTVAHALVVSCDTVFYKFGWEFYQKQPAEPLQRDLGTFGFGKPTLIDLPNEQPGVVPTPEWLHRMHRENPTAFPRDTWYPGDDIQMGIGQGDTLVTPLQIATAYSAIANGGHVCQPHVASELTGPGLAKPKTLDPHCGGKLPFTSGQLEYIRNALAQVPHTGGTAAPAFGNFPFSQVWVAGKTGTAEKIGQQNYSWFAAMAGDTPNHADYVIVSLVEQGGHGATTSAPIVRRVIEGLYGLNLSAANPSAPND